MKYTLGAIRLPEAVWTCPETVNALRQRDVGLLFSLARKYMGASQLRIATLCQMDQGEVSRVMNGRRQITSIDVLARIADALAMPDEARILMGMAPLGPYHRPASGAAAEPAHGQTSGTPALRTVPEPLTALIGRELDVEIVRQSLGEHRLVTLVGPPGVGKTRLGVAVARAAGAQFGDIAYVPLADVDSASRTLAEISRTFGVDTPGSDPRSTLIRALGDRDLLMVLDNVEQLLSAAPLIADLMSAVPRLRVLATSRERLRIAGEQLHRVQPLGGLDCPPDGMADAAQLIEDAHRSPAVQLFVVRAKAVTADFDIRADNAGHLLQLCRLLDGLPLAIELAASRIATFTPQELLVRIQKCMKLCSDGNRDLPLRHQALGSAIAWSYTLLNHAERTLFTRLSVFVGGVPLEAIEDVCRFDEDTTSVVHTLAALVDKHLVYVFHDVENRTRYAMLHTIRSFAGDELDTAERSHMRHRHTAHYRELAAQAEQGWLATQTQWIGRLEREYANLSAALSWAMECGDRVTASVIVCGLRRFWMTGRYLQDGHRWYETVLADADGLPSVLRGRLLLGLGYLSCWRTELTAARRHGEAALTVFRTVADAAEIANALNLLGLVSAASGDYAAAQSSYELCLETWQVLGDRRRTGVSLCNLGELARRRGDFDAAAEHLAQGLELLTSAEDALTAVFCLADLAEVRIWQGHLEQARPLAQSALVRSRELPERFVEAMSLNNLGRLAGLAGDREQQRHYDVAALKLRQTIGDQEGLAKSLEAFAVLAADDDADFAARLLGAAEAQRELIGRPLAPVYRPILSECIDRLGHNLGAAALSVQWETGRTTSLNEMVSQVLGWHFPSNLQ